MKQGAENFRCIRSDDRKRAYVAPVRLVRVTGEVIAAERLLGDEVQSYAYPGQPVCLIPPGGEVLLDFGRELAGGARLVTAPNDGRLSRVRLTFGESVSEAIGEPDNDHAIHQTVLTLPPTGMTEYGNTGFRFLRLEVPAAASQPLELIGVCAVAVYRDLPYVGCFQSSDPVLNRIWETGAYTVHLNMQDCIYDGIKRDRMVWMGDLYPEVRTILAVFDDTQSVEDTLDFAVAHTPDGEWMNRISSYSAWWIICQHDWYWRRGRMEYLRRQHAFLRQVTGQLADCVAADGVERLTGTRFLDWPTQADPAATHAGLQGLLAWALRCAAELAAILGDDQLERVCRTTLARLLAAPVPPTRNKSAAAMLALGNPAAAATWNRNVFAVEPERGLSTFYGYFVLEARALAGDLSGALEVMRRYWGGMLACGATTFWEDFDLDWLANAGRIDELPEPGRADIHADFGRYCYQGLRHSLCHGWAGGPTAFLSEHVLGVTPLSPGFRDVAIQPNFAGLTEIFGRVPTPFGPIEVEGTPQRVHWRTPDGIRVWKTPQFNTARNALKADGSEISVRNCVGVTQ